MPNTDNSKLNFIYDFNKSALANFKFNMSQVDDKVGNSKAECKLLAKEAINIISFNDFSIHACYIKAANMYVYSSKNLDITAGYQTNKMFFAYTHGSIYFIANNGASLSSFGINKTAKFSNTMTFRPLEGDDNLVITHTDELYIYTSNPTDFLHNINFNTPASIYIYHPEPCNECVLESQPTEKSFYDEL